MSAIMQSCCFIGHRKIKETQELKNSIYNIVENLILNKGINTFYFGSKSDFNDLCYEITSRLKEKYSYIQRIYVRAEFQHIDDSYRNYLLEYYEDTYYPPDIANAGKAVYVKRNLEMIKRSEYCIIYYDENYIPQKRTSINKNQKSYQPKSGTKQAYDYAIKRCNVINVFHNAENSQN